MSDLVLGESSRSVRVAPFSLGGRLARRAIVSLLSRLTRGEIVLVEPDRRTRFGAATAELPDPAELVVVDPRFFRAAAFGGSIGVGEAYMDGWWRSDDLPRLLRIVAANPEISAGVEGPLARLRIAIERIGHRRRRNSKPGSRRNVEAHYDLGNEFFALFLDPTRMYSSAVFPSPEASLEEASIHKLDGVCRALGLASGDRVVEIGTGWGGFALHAARNYGCRVTTVTVSPAQHAHAAARVREAGLTDRVTVLLADYRDLPRTVGTGFDKGVSIEMIEAVGHEYFPAYFRVWRELLAPGGKLFLQAIVIADDAYDRYRGSVDFIQRYVFPGGCLPSLEVLRETAARARLSVGAPRDITPHYAETLRRWRRRFLANAPRAAELGLSRRFLRMWDYYLCYCEAGFEARTIGCAQLVLERPAEAG